MAGNKTLVAMKRADGTPDSIIHLPDATTVKPAADGTVMIPRAVRPGDDQRRLHDDRSRRHHTRSVKRVPS
jgi:hypothetical protein